MMTEGAQCRGEVVEPIKSAVLAAIMSFFVANKGVMTLPDILMVMMVCVVVGHLKTMGVTGSKDWAHLGGTGRGLIEGPVLIVRAHCHLIFLSIAASSARPSAAAAASAPYATTLNTMASGASLLPMSTRTRGAPVRTARRRSRTLGTFRSARPAGDRRRRGAVANAQIGDNFCGD